MLLAISNSEDETTDHLLRKVAGAGLPHVRLDSDTLHERAEISFRQSQVTLRIDGQHLVPQQLSNVWLRRPKRLTVDVGRDDAEREHSRREWSASVEGFLAQIPANRWINHPSANAAASHKLDQLARAAAFGLDIPDSLVTHEPASAVAFAARHRHAIVAKPLAAGYLERDTGTDSLIYTTAIPEEDLRTWTSRWGCPTLLQEYIDKTTDVRVTVLDDFVVAYAIDRVADGKQVVDVRSDNMAGATYRVMSVPEPTRTRLLALLRAYRLRFAAVDFVVDRRGRWIFLEINPNGQWAWLDLFGGANIWRIFVDTFRRPSEPRVPALSAIDSATWLALKTCRIDVTRDQVRLRRYDHQQYVPQIRPEQNAGTKELLDYAVATYARATERRKYVDEKAKLLGGFVTFAITICSATASRIEQPVAMMPALVLFVITLLLLLSYFRLGIAAQPSVAADEAQRDGTDLSRQLIADYLSSADHNERSTSFCADIFRAAVITFIAGIVALTLAVPLFVSS